MNCCEFAPPYVRAIAPYQPGKPISELARELGLNEADIVKLASNENPLGPSPMALAAAQDALHDMALYPDGAGFALKAKLSAKLGVAARQIVLGNGSNDILDMAARAFLAPGTSAVYAQHAFAVYPIATQTVGAQGIAVPAKDYGHDLAAMRAAIRDDTRVLWIANPNNPTGTFLPWTEIEAFLATVPPQVLVVLDEAYGEYLPADVVIDATGDGHVANFAGAGYEQGEGNDATYVQPISLYFLMGGVDIGKAIAFMVKDSWVWQMHHTIPLEDMTHENFWRQLLRWLVDGVPSAVEVHTSAERVEAGESVTVTTDVVDKSYVELNDAKVVATVNTPSGKAIQVPLQWTGERNGQYRGTFVADETGPYATSVEAVRDNTKSTILSAMHTRLGNDRHTEFNTACGQVERIALLRLRAILPEL